MNEMYERNLPECLANDLSPRKKGVEENSCLLDVLSFRRFFALRRNESGAGLFRSLRLDGFQVAL